MKMVNERQRSKLYKEILDEYNKQDRKQSEKEGNVIKFTEKGFFVPSSIRQVYSFFNHINLEKYRNFIDLGAGDGRIALLASIFTKSSGIEVNEELYKKSIRNKHWLGLDANLMEGNYMEHDISQYDVVYMYPDDVIGPELNRKLKSELKGDLILFTNTFLPKGLEIKQIKHDWMTFCICKNI